MESVRSNVAMGVQPQKKSNKVLKHAVNAGILVGGSTAIARGAWELCANHRLYDPQIIKPEYMRPIQKFFEKIGEKIFAPSTFLGELFGATFGQNAKHYDNYKTALKQYKARGAVLALGAVAIISFITAGIYKAGKINGEN